MPSNDQKKTANYGGLCGLRPDAVYDSDSSEDCNTSLSRKMTEKQSQIDTTTPQRRPQSLTLPFENRERESHLVTEEEFDRILKQEGLDSPLPPLPNGISRSISGLGLRRSVSTARDTKVSAMSQRTRPMSADWSKTISNATSQQSQQGQDASIAQDPTLTALPRASTRNDLLVYPPQASPRQQAQAHPHPHSRGYVQCQRRHAFAADNDNFPTMQAPPEYQNEPLSKRGHKRHFSAADMVETLFKKRQKRTNSPALGVNGDAAGQSPINIRDTPIGNPTTSPRPTKRSHGTTFTGNANDRRTIDLATALAETQIAIGNHNDTDTDMPLPPTSTLQPAYPLPRNDLKKSILKRTWSRTKHAARHSISISKPLASPSSSSHRSSPLRISEPAESGRGSDGGCGTPTPVPSIYATPASTGTGTGTGTGYLASTEQSPALSGTTSHIRSSPPLHPSTTPYTNTYPSPPQHQDRYPYEYISGPTPKPSLLTRLGTPPRRKELNTVVARQQSRIVDLTVLNRVLVGQVEGLRGQIEGGRSGCGGVWSLGQGSGAGEACHNRVHREGGTNMQIGRRERVSDFQNVFAMETGEGRPMSSSEMGIVEEARKSRGFLPGRDAGIGVDARNGRDGRGRIDSFDPQGWRRIMGVRSQEDVLMGGDSDEDHDGDVGIGQGQHEQGRRGAYAGVDVDVDVDMGWDDKRKTWMTCDS